MAVTIFFCYAHEDEALLNKLKAHLRPLQREGLIDIWYDRNISAGTGWEHAIQQHLDAAQLILLLISPDFMNSDYCYGIEMQRALERHARGEARVVPIILRPAYWHGKPLGSLQALPTDGKPVTSPYWHDLDSALYDVTAGIYKVVEHMTPAPSTSAPIVEVTQQRVAQARHIAPSPEPAKKTAPFPVEKFRLLRTLTDHTDSVNSIAISPDGQTLVSGSADKTIKVWNLFTGRVLQTLTGHTSYVYTVAISPDGRILVSGSKDKVIRVRDLLTGKEIRTLTDRSATMSLALSPDGQALVSGGTDSKIRIWTLSTGNIMRTFIGHTDFVFTVAISSDGETLVSGSEDKTIKVWNLSTGKELRTLTGHTGAVRSVIISSDGQTLVSGSEDHTIKVWNLSAGKELRTLTGHTNAVRSIAISPDGQTLVSGSYDHAIKVWNLPMGEELRTLTGHIDDVQSVAISPDGQALVSGSCDHTIKVWGV